MGLATGLQQHNISRLMNGVTKSPKIETVRALCDGLGIPRDLAGLAPIARAQVEPEEDITNRRDFLSGLVGLSAAIASVGAADELPDQLSSAEAEKEVGRLRDAVPELLVLNDRHGGADGLCRLAAGIVDRADALLQHGCLSTALTREVQRLVGELAMNTGWLYFDAGNQGRARAYWEQAMLQAQLAGEQLVEVYALESLSTQAAFFLHRPHDAVQLAVRAQQVAAGWASPRLKSLVAMREATGWAARQDRDGFNKAYRQAMTHLEKDASDGDPKWLDFYTTAEVRGLEALSWMSMGDGRRAEAIFREMVNEVDPEHRRNQLYYAAILARVAAENGNISGAADDLIPRLEAIASTGSWRTQNHARKAVAAARQVKTARARALVDAGRTVGLADGAA